MCSSDLSFHSVQVALKCLPLNVKTGSFLNVKPIKMDSPMNILIKSIFYFHILFNDSIFSILIFSQFGHHTLFIVTTVV